MKEEDAIKKFFPKYDDTTFGKMFIQSLYKEGYIIITPEEREKIDGALVLAHIHGMNPFDKKKEKKEKPKIFSGKNSVEMWNEINNAKTIRDLRDALYHICCKLQELECRLEKKLED